MPSALVASVVIAAIVSGAVATGVTLGLLRLQARTNPQQVDLASGVTISEDSATSTVAQKAAPAVVSIVTRDSDLTHGSGFLVTSDGYIVTNVAAVANAQSPLGVLLSTDNHRHDARVVDYDCQTGLAVLKVDQVSNLPTLAFGDSSSLRLGQNVIVLGGMLDEQHGVSRGIVSGLNRSVMINDPRGGGDEAQLSNVIQTDASIEPGNSGGPLLNVGGQVIGVTMAAISRGQPVAFAVASGDVQPQVEQIVQSGQLVVPSLGARTVDVTAAVAAMRGAVAGAHVTSVDPGSPADRAGLKAGDVITQLDDQRLDDAHPLAQVLRTRFKPDQRATVTYTRGGSAGQVQLALGGEHPTCP